MNGSAAWVVGIKALVINKPAADRPLRLITPARDNEIVWLNG